jgi:hypothetical protein
MKKLLLIALLSFLIFFQNGENGILKNAVGFYIEEGCYFFFNSNADQFFGPIPADQIKAVVYLPDDKVA